MLNLMKQSIRSLSEKFEQKKLIFGNKSMVLFGQITLKPSRFKNGHFGSRKRTNTMLINFVMLIELFLKTSENNF